jgi:hypothetical protein
VSRDEASETSSSVIEMTDEIDMDETGNIGEAGPSTVPPILPPVNKPKPALQNLSPPSPHSLFILSLII